MPMVRLATGTLLSGRYQVGELIGESDLSAVYSASDQRGHAHVALKVFDPAVKARAAALSEYQAQARQASGLGVEGVARAYDFGIDANSGLPFSTAERIGWSSLDRRVLAQGPLSVAELARALTVLARALDAAHAAGLVHRDLKPQNVFISPDNPEWVRITDFGVGALRRGAPEAMGWGGPPGYTPPDAVDAAAAATPASDLFALGVVSFFALTRGSPFRSLRGATFDPNAHWIELNQPFTPISERAHELGVALDPALDPWFARALAIGVHDRFGHAGDMARELFDLSERLTTRGGGARAMPGIAAAIAQPLLFQPDPSPTSLGSAPTAPVTTSAMAAVAAAASPARTSETKDGAALAEPTNAGPRRNKLAVPLMVGMGVLLLGGLALAGYAVSQQREATGPTSPSLGSSSSLASTTARAPSAPPSAASPPLDGPSEVELPGAGSAPSGTIAVPTPPRAAPPATTAKATVAPAARSAASAPVKGAPVSSARQASAATSAKAAPAAPTKA